MNVPTSFFSNSFDTVSKQAQTPRITSLNLRFGLIWGGPIVLSDTQVIDSISMRKLFRKGVRSLLRRPKSEKLPIIIYTRNTQGFEKTLEDFIDIDRLREKEGPALFSSLTPEKQKLVNEAYKRGRLEEVQDFYDIVDPGSNIPFKNHIEFLNDLYLKRKDNSLFKWAKLRLNYSKEIISTLEKCKGHWKQKESEKLGDLIIEHIENWSGDLPPTRTGFYRFFDTQPQFPTYIKEKMKMLVIDLAYNANFALSNKLGFLSHTGTPKEVFEKELPEIAKETLPRKHVIMNKKPLKEKLGPPLSPNLINYGFLSEVWHQKEFQESISKFKASETPNETAQAISEHARLVTNKLKAFWKDRIDFETAPFRLTYSKPLKTIDTIGDVSALPNILFKIFGWNFGSFPNEIGFAMRIFGSFAVILTIEGLIGFSIDKYVYEPYRWRQFSNALSETVSFQFS